MNCPKCKTPTALVETELVEANIVARPSQCPTCKGRLFHTGDLKRIEDTVVLKPFEPPASIPTSRTQHKTMRCPRCPDRPIMRKVSNQRHEEVITDVCPKCESVWLDAGELERIREEGLFATIVFCLKWLRE